MINEKRLIDAYKLEDHLQSNRIRYHNKEDFIAAIAEQPTVNAVEVTRCGACKEWTEIAETGGAGYCNHPCWILADAEPPIVQFADFCSYGERKDNE